MKIAALKLYSVPLTSLETYYMAAGKRCDVVESIVLELCTNEGVTGWGEVCPIPHYLPAYAKGVAPVLRELSPYLLGEDPTNVEALMGVCDSVVQGHVYAKSALDMALWDVLGKVTGVPLYKLLGGKRQDAAPLYHSITCTDPAQMAEIAKTAYDEGIRQFQAKLGATGTWETDVERLRAVRNAVGTEPLLYGDWNCGATKLEAIRVAQTAKKLDVMLEQPCDTIKACAEVRHVSGMAMKLDESVHDIHSLLKAHELGCADVVALKLSKFGGITAIRRARDLCAKLGIMMVVEDTWGSDITTAALSHLAISTPEKYLLNCCDLSGYVTPHIAPDGPRRQNATLTPPEHPGLGITPDRDVLGKSICVIE